MTFEKGNGITAHFDFIHYYEDIPDGVDFKVEEETNGYVLRAFGYGQLSYEAGPGAYGSGALRVYRSELTLEQDARFRKGLGYVVTWGGKVRSSGLRPEGK